MCVDDVKIDPAAGVRYLTAIDDAQAGRRLKTESSVRSVPFPPELVRIGFTEFVEHANANSGPNARLFPPVKAGPKGSFGETWSKWFGRYKRSLGIDNPNSVFHSFRHGFKDALRIAGLGKM
jgi:integrase